MPQKDYRAYAQTPAGRAARARAHARYVQKRRDENARKEWNTAPLVTAVSNWRNA